ncbi:hypothetical protein ACFSO7_12855 [Bacillus sp. CGMCC 1.16607]|uniref:hypothetical protein n=1 Tax=Bacillus sp. CGMCC 1.16607 TaxID=3351842 RepID=UPI00363ED64E
MMVKMNRKLFDSLEDIELGGKCFEPIIPLIRGKDNWVKTQVYNKLTKGQQALFMFCAYYNHVSKSLVEFYWWSAYYLAQPKIWSELKLGLQYFKADAMIRLLDDIEERLKDWDHPRNIETFDVSYRDLGNDPELQTIVSSLNTQFNNISPEILIQIGYYIRENPHEFIEFED